MRALTAFSSASAPSAFLPEQVRQSLWESHLIKHKGITAVLNAVCKASGLSASSELTPTQERELDNIFELLQVAEYYAKDFLGTSHVPDNVYNILAARPFIEMEEETVLQALPEEAMAFLGAVRHREENPDYFRDERSPENFCRRLFEWQEVGAFNNRVLSGDLRLDDEAAFLELYAYHIGTPYKPYLSDQSKLEIETARRIQEIDFIINNHHRERFWYIDYVAKTPASDLTAKTLFEYTDWHLTPELWHPFQLAFDYCLGRANGDPHRATHIFAREALNPLSVYAYLGGKPSVGAYALTLFYSSMKDDPDLQTKLCKIYGGRLGTLIALSSPRTRAEALSQADELMLRQIQNVECAHAINSLTHRQFVFSWNKVPMIQIRDDLLAFHDDIIAAEALPCPSTELRFQRKMTVDSAKDLYTLLSQMHEVLELPPLPPSNPPRKNSEKHEVVPFLRLIR